MRSLLASSWITISCAIFSVCACGSDDKPASENEKPKCTLGTNAGCQNNQVCEEVPGGEPACFDPIRIQGTVTNAADATAIAGALVVALDANGAAVSATATTDSAGKYSVLVPVSRTSDGTPVANVSYTLRADASLFQSFPTPPRVAIPVKVDQPVSGVVTGAATSISLLRLPQTTPTGSISGKVSFEQPKGTLVVAGGSTALTASDGTFTVFNVAPGTVTVSAYRQGANIAPASVTVTADQTTKDVTLAAAAKPAVTVSGKVSIVNPGSGTNTSVILVVEDTFIENAARGESPPGLRAANVGGDFSISGVPDGKYVVLAAFENDHLVRDPDTCIGGTAIVRVTVAGQDVTLAESFKVTGALDVVSPDAEQVVTATPSFVWVDDSSEDNYMLSVYDAFGNLVWENNAVPGVSGNQNVTVAYAGPALTPGMVYQYRATSVHKNCPISRTEDLRGVFRVQ
ncbi:MAG TPA: hypothetical protein VKP30_20210 [Polyangiaceae bacterium]|nr:hypothetical protein [Polyangiaceae bacterium]